VEEQAFPGLGAHFINTEQVFEHLPSPLQTGAQLVSALVPNGVLKVSVPYAPWLERDVASIEINWEAATYAPHSPMAVHPLEHLTYFRRPSLNTMAARIGMREVRLRPTEELNYAFYWNSLRSVAKNLARPFLRRTFRNYFLYAKV
jgi:hypothetical protein